MGRPERQYLWAGQRAPEDFHPPYEADEFFNEEVLEREPMVLSLCLQSGGQNPPLDDPRLYGAGIL